MKEYPLGIEPIYRMEGQGHPVGFFSRGHHDEGAFLAAICDWLEVAARVPRYPVRHTYYRIVPDVRGEVSFYVEAKGPGRGAFPVTVEDAP